MYTYTLNIGLENNPLTAYQIEELINFIVGPNGRIYTRQETGEYNGEEERTLIVMLAGTTFDRYFISNELIQILCLLCTQECISVKGAGYADLIYNNAYSGEKFNFDPQYFISY